MKLFLLKTCLLLIPVFVLDITVWKVKKSAISFQIKNAGVTINGAFYGLKSEIKFDPLKLQESNIFASVDSKTVNTEMESRDNHLRKPDYFDVEKYPLITLQSVKLEKTGPITFNGTFKLTIKDITKEVVIPFSFIKIPEKNQLKGNFTINRRDYGIGSSSMILADDVTINLDVELTE